MPAFHYRSKPRSTAKYPDFLRVLAALTVSSNLRSTILVTLILILSFTFTGFLSSAYKNQKESRGRAHYDLGQAALRAGDLQQAIEEYRKALLFLPDDSDYGLSLAIALVDSGRLDEAESHLQELLEGNPTNGVINLMLARVAAKRKETNQAIDYYQRAVYGYWPQSNISARRAARWELVSLLQKQDRRNELVGELMQLYANAPDEPNEKSKIGFMLLQYGATSNAVEVFRDLARDHPKYVEAHHGLGEAYFDSGDYVAARREVQQAIHLDPRDKENVQLLALANAVIGIDPALPRLSTADRLARSHALLERVLRDLSECVLANGGKLAPPLQQRIDGANVLLASKAKGADDYLFQLQDTAQQLWKDKKDFCGNISKPDRALDVVLTRLGQ
jgi:tetratricopeptide (TPR) repeat protein